MDDDYKRKIISLNSFSNQKQIQKLLQSKVDILNHCNFDYGCGIEALAIRYECLLDLVYLGCDITKIGCLASYKDYKIISTWNLSKDENDKQKYLEYCLYKNDIPL
ncbi:MAG: hypothetical protein RR144_04615 [Clostridia bacterium]